MAKTAFEAIAAGLEEAIAYRKGTPVAGTRVHEVEVEVDAIDVKALRNQKGAGRGGRRRKSPVLGLPSR